MTERRRCKSNNAKGEPCGAAPLRPGTILEGTVVSGDYCRAHDPDLPDSARIGGPQPGAGRPPKPKATDVLRQIIEQDIEGWLAPLMVARMAERAVVVGTGPGAHVEFVPDHNARLAAVREAFNRAYGSPKGSSEVTVNKQESAIDAEIERLLGEVDGQIERRIRERLGEMDDGEGEDPVSAREQDLWRERGAESSQSRS